MFGFNIEKFISSIKKDGVAHPTHYEIDFGSFKSGGIVFDRKISELLDTRLESVSFPSSTIGSRGQVHLGIEREMPYGRIYEGDIELSFIETSEYTIRKSFTEWQSKIIDPVNYTHGYYNDYVSDLEIKTYLISSRTELTPVWELSRPPKGTLVSVKNPLKVPLFPDGDVIDAQSGPDKEGYIPPQKPPWERYDLKFEADVPKPAYSVKLIDVFPKTINQIDLSAGEENLVKTKIVLSYRKWISDSSSSSISPTNFTPTPAQQPEQPIASFTNPINFGGLTPNRGID